MYIMVLEWADGATITATRHSWEAVVLFLEENAPWVRVIITHK